MRHIKTLHKFVYGIDTSLCKRGWIHFVARGTSNHSNRYAGCTGKHALLRFPRKVGNRNLSFVRGCRRIPRENDGRRFRFLNRLLESLTLVAADRLRGGEQIERANLERLQLSTDLS